MENILQNTSHCLTDCVVMQPHCCGWDMVERVVERAIKIASAANVSKIVFFGSTCCGDSRDLKKITQLLKEQGIDCCWVGTNGAWSNLPVRLDSFAQVAQLVEFTRIHNVGRNYLDELEKLQKEGLLPTLEKALQNAFGDTRGTRLYWYLTSSGYVSTYPRDIPNALKKE